MKILVALTPKDIEDSNTSKIFINNGTNLLNYDVIKNRVDLQQHLRLYKG